MAEYVYVGPGPAEDQGVLVHPGDVRDFEDEPDCPPWRLLQPERGRASEHAPLASPPVPVKPLTAPQDIAAPAAKPEGM